MSLVRYARDASMSRLGRRVVLGAAAFVGLFAPLVLNPADWLGWVVIYLSLSIVLFSRSLRSSRESLLAAMISALAAVVCVIIYSYYFILPGGETDSEEFFRLGVQHSRSFTLPEYSGGSSAFAIILTLFMMIGGPSKLLAHSIGCLGTVLSFIAYARLRGLLYGRTSISPVLMLVFGLTPSALFLRTAVLREAWQSFFFISAVYYFCKLIRQASPSSLLLFLCFGGLAAMLHAAFGVFLLGAGAIYWFGGLLGRSKNRVLVVVAGALLLVPLLSVGATLAMRDPRVAEFRSGAVQYGAIDALASLPSSAKGDASYANAPGMNAHPIVRLFAGFYYYWLAPLPWQIRGLQDVAAFLENLLRVFAVVMIALAVIRGRANERGEYDRAGVLAATSCAMLLEFVWSVGTTNWGAAIRHHIPAFGVFLAAFPPSWVFRRVGRTKESIPPTHRAIEDN